MMVLDASEAVQNSAVLAKERIVLTSFPFSQSELPEDHAYHYCIALMLLFSHSFFSHTHKEHP